MVKEDDDCWIWLSFYDKHGYGRFNLNYKQYLAHRVAYKICYNIDPLTKLVLHNCDNPKCVNPNHLYLGTQKDNVNDAINRFRRYKPNAKLNVDDILWIREHKSKLKPIELSEKFGVSVVQIRNILNYKNWSDIK